mmetsp:Transcript_97077/g.307945  ORF Transcript_97077/g.307945 Transcript_97077/m.307945 type:complete len:282 (+) Transcript_97077:840-1685(+)
MVQNLADRRALLLVLVQHHVDQRPQVAGVRLVGFRDLVPADLPREYHQGVRIERVLQSGRLVQDHATAPDVALIVVGLLLDYFWAEVVGRADHGLGIALHGLEHPRDAKVTQLDLAAGHEEDVLGLEVPVKHPPRVDVQQRETDLDEPSQDCCLRQQLPLPLVDCRVDVAAVGVVHDDAEPALPCHEHVLELDDVWVLQLLQHQCLLHRFLALLAVHDPRVHLLHDAHGIILRIPNKEGLAKRAFAYDLDPPVLGLHDRGAVPSGRSGPSPARRKREEGTA